MGDLIVLVVVAVLIGVGGVRLGMLLAPAVGRLAGPDEDEPTDGPPASEPDPDHEPAIDIEPPARRSHVTTPEPPIEDLAFDDALAELQRTVAELETGGQPLEEAIALYERGVALQARCEQLLAMPSCGSSSSSQRAGGALEIRGRQRRGDRPTEPGPEPGA